MGLAGRQRTTSPADWRTAEGLRASATRPVLTPATARYRLAVSRTRRQTSGNSLLKRSAQ